MASMRTLAQKSPKVREKILRLVRDLMTRTQVFNFLLKERKMSGDNIRECDDLLDIDG